MIMTPRVRKSPLSTLVVGVPSSITETDWFTRITPVRW